LTVGQIAILSNYVNVTSIQRKNERS